MKNYFYWLVLFSLCTIPPAIAENNQSEMITTNEWHISVALGYGAVDNPRTRSKAIESYILPSWSYYGGNFYVENFTLGYSLYESDNLLLDVQTQINDDGILFKFDGLNKLFLSDILGFAPAGLPINSKQPIFEEIERNISYLGGMSATWLTPYADISLGYYHDISGVHQGNEIQLRLKRNINYAWGSLGFQLGAVRKSQNIVGYYYQLTPEEEGPLHFKYRPNATVNYFTRGVLNIPLWENLNIVGILEYTWLGKGITDSIMIEKDGYLSGFIGISYGF